METRILKGSKFIGLTPKQILKKFGIKVIRVTRGWVEVSSQKVIIQRGDYIETQQLRRKKK